MKAFVYNRCGSPDVFRMDEIPTPVPSGDQVLIRRSRGVHLRLVMVPQNRADLLEITARVEAGEVRPIIDRRFRFEETPEAMRYVSEGLALGKVVITFGT